MATKSESKDSAPKTPVGFEGTGLGLSIWKQVDVTDKKDTREVNLGRKFTAIDAYSQIRKATEVFGPIGYGWGVDGVRFDFESVPDHIVYTATFWYVDKGRNRHQFPMASMAPLWLTKKGEKYKVDSDAIKKVVTDALTKAFSYLGFNADVFMGMFDGNRYVAEHERKQKEKVKEAFNPKDMMSGSEYGLLYDMFKLEKFGGSEDISKAFEAWAKENKPLLTYGLYLKVSKLFEKPDAKAEKIFGNIANIAEKLMEEK